MPTPSERRKTKGAKPGSGRPPDGVSFGKHGGASVRSAASRSEHRAASRSEHRVASRSEHRVASRSEHRVASRSEHREDPRARGTLVVVESPAKAKSLSKMLGDGFEVRASKGHVADLPEHTLGVDVENDFAPTYEVKKEKKEVVKELKKAAQGRQVLIATDPDREGEAIGW
ncbi:toprim domain-containing protein, partial [Thermus sp.]|uniref:toprim domain-containing protein n=1 Tax=Thermus sp. TaxID=275 RepID=UPI00331A85C7